MNGTAGQKIGPNARKVVVVDFKQRQETKRLKLNTMEKIARGILKLCKNVIWLIAVMEKVETFFDVFD